MVEALINSEVISYLSISEIVRICSILDSDSGIDSFFTKNEDRSVFSLQLEQQTDVGSG